MKRTAVRYSLPVLALFSFALLATISSARKSEVPGVSIENFGKVNDHYYRGSQPTQEGVAELKQLGIKTVIDLREDFKKDEESWVRESGMNFYRIPLKTRVAATDEQTNYFLSIVDDPANWPVYVHCKGGRHRTGAMTGIYRISHEGWTAEQAWQEMKDYDFNDSIFGGPPAQKKYVFAFYERHHSAATDAHK